MLSGKPSARKLRRGSIIAAITAGSAIATLLPAAFRATLDRMPAICPYTDAMNPKDKEGPVPINIAAAAFNQNAFANLTADSDDFIRNQVLIDEPGEKQEFNRNLAFRVAE